MSDGSGGSHDESSKGLRKRAKEKRKNFELHIIQVDPTELFIAGTYFYQRLKYLTVSNRCNERVAYKTRITHPENYIVKPSAGFLDPKDSVLIRVLLYKYTTETFKEKHYLQLLALPIGLDKPASTEKFWKNLEKSKTAVSSMYLPIHFTQKSKRMGEDAQTKYVLRTLEKLCDRQDKSKRRHDEDKQSRQLATPTTTSIGEREFKDIQPSEQLSFLHDFLHYVDLYPEVLIYIICFLLLVIIIIK